MPISHQNSNGQTNSTTAVDIVSAPAASAARIIPIGGISVKNMDTAIATVILQLVDAGPVTREIEEQASVAVDATFTNSTVITLASTDQKLQVVLAGAITTNQLDYVVSYMEIT